MSRPVWAEIDLRAIAHNTRQLKNLLAPRTELMAVVKANAYGHGAVPVARTALANGASWLGVATVDEAVELRRAGVGAPILILGYLSLEDAPIIVKEDISQTVFNLEQARALSRAASAAGRTAKIHLKIDTGMGRLGVFPEEALEVARAICGLPGVVLEGIFTHFANADALDKTYTWQQLKTFERILQELERAGINIPWKHAANSGAILDLPATHFNLVRAGISLYGHYPSEEVDRGRLELQPAMAFKTRVILVKEVPPGSYISYGCTYCAPRPTRVATLPVGYADGFSRLLSNRGEVLVRGRRAPVIGRVCMDYCMIDVTAIPGVQVGDEVVLFGRQGEAVLPAEEVAGRLGTVNYEVLCMVSHRVPRVYLYEETRS
ncbi:alanine racemase [Thermanaeromonas sp. C210]|uniref:alanine racemase n=1 Tax=Thermanaeromonas sp. C210 TaxID=2731925 RepID=UPI00155BB357|nr:alanine racemase [Thermanaeromonas sp. C210]GFN22040.1 alanine racemase [Thermanaeromonas sp. C210]